MLVVQSIPQEQLHAVADMAAAGRTTVAAEATHIATRTEGERNGLLFSCARTADSTNLVVSAVADVRHLVVSRRSTFTLLSMHLRSTSEHRYISPI